jgi:hypothetical protein
MEYSKGLRFSGDCDELEKCVSGTGLVGSWKEIPNGHRQFITDDGGILNWAPSTGSIWFQGVESAAEDLEREFKAAAKGRIKLRCRHAEKSLEAEDIGTLKKLLADALLENEKLRRRGAR